jgi:hypothetical protein
LAPDGAERAFGPPELTGALLINLLKFFFILTPAYKYEKELFC